MKASIIAIGSELTTGQILNKNASTLSAKIKNYGIELGTHITVPDDHSQIIGALQYLEGKCDLLFITGGLGPTSDDFTRDVIAEWAGLNMRFDEATWKHIQDRLTSRGLKVLDVQKKQCLFPEGSSILFNSQGTAHGFQLEVRKKEKTMLVWVLPGPPREIEAIWKDHINVDLIRLTIDIDKIIYKSWDTIGVGESEVAERVNVALNSTDNNLLNIGYRVHLPYVEVKLWHKLSDEPLCKEALRSVEDHLKDITVARDFKDVAERFCELTRYADFTIYDYVSDGFLHSRLSPHLRDVPRWSYKQSDESPPVDFFENEDNFLALLPVDATSCLVFFSLDGKKTQKQIVSVYNTQNMQERRKQYFAEMSLVEFLNSL